jgi:Tol biopolymer transport system component
MKPLLAEPAWYGSPRLSPDGQRVAFHVADGSNKSIWVYHLERKTRIRLTSGVDVHGFLAWSPDGRYLASYSNVGILWLRADGAGKPITVTQSKNPQYPYSFTPDGKRLAFMESNPETGWDIWTISVEANSEQPRAEKPQVLLQTSSNELYPAFSPDGRWLAYSSDESGTGEVYVRPFPDTGGKWLISDGGGVMPVWSRNLRELFYETEDGRIMAVKYSANGNSFAATKPTVWSERRLVDTVLAPNFDIAPDGNRFAVLLGLESASEQKAGSQVVFLLNFFDELRRRAPAGGKIPQP